MASVPPWDCPYWTLKGRVDSAAFFRALPGAFPGATTLFVEGSPVPEVAEFYRAAVQDGPYLPDRGTIWPKQALFRVRFDAATLAGIADLQERTAEPDMLDHLHVYAGESPLLSWWDALDPGIEMAVAGSVAPEVLRQFADGLGFVVRRVEP